jgi:hypothetical protein
MLNFLIALLTAASYNSGYFWPMLFIAIAFWRLKSNSIKTLFWLSALITVIGECLILLKISEAFVTSLLIFQLGLCAVSILINVYKVFKRKPIYDYVFFCIEPVLLFIFSSYFQQAHLFFISLKKLFLIYLPLQAIVALWELFGIKIEITENEFAFGICPQSPIDKLLNETWIKFQIKLAFLSGIVKSKKDLKNEMKNNGNKKETNWRKVKIF